ncbi:CaiB/BaiF CoA-transferase family protein [Nocardioides sp.]|uniref:CaiB/BaiF CoA transferase family protein n=1 Tax=Nocardioides sp. TaxID=35761 RepID=UPI002734603B|nr:CoA transferase [Nocardioides sp.]MDP3890777.1 CoA transferase [Nocardioides sp.]
MHVLDGIKVVDLTAWAFCPAAGAVLASWGAEVIHIENPASPDPMRLYDGGSIAPGKANWMFKHYNRGKKSLALDLASHDGREIFYGLIAQADVFLTSYLPATRRKLGIDIDEVRAHNPQLIVAKGTGQGPLGPEAERGGFDGASWWSRGSLAASAMGVADVDRPTGMVGHGDGMSGMVLAGGICAALVQRERTGVPSVVDGSLLGTALWFNGPAVVSSNLDGVAPVFASKPARTDVPWSMSTYRTDDGRFLYLSLIGDPQSHWVDLCRHVGRPDLADDPRFADPRSRGAHNADLVTLFDEIFASRTYAEWGIALATLRGVWAPVQKADEMGADPQVVANGMIQKVRYDDGDLDLVGMPVMFDQRPAAIGRAPDFGEHTEEILASLDVSSAGIADFRARGVVG